MPPNLQGKSVSLRGNLKDKDSFCSNKLRTNFKFNRYLFNKIVYPLFADDLHMQMILKIDAFQGKRATKQARGEMCFSD